LPKSAPRSKQKLFLIYTLSLPLHLYRPKVPIETAMTPLLRKVDYMIVAEQREVQC